MPADVNGRRVPAAAAIMIGVSSHAVPTAAAGTTPAGLRINEIQVLGTHNSYHVEPPPGILDVYLEADPDSINLAYTHEPLATQLDEQGVRQFEPDLVADPDGDLFRPMGTTGWKVLHTEQIDERSTCETLIRCLEEILVWSTANPGHVPITVLAEFKVGGEIPGGVDAPPVTPESMIACDAEVRSVFEPARLITPDDVRGDHATLQDAVLDDGWPTVDQSRGKVMVVLNDHREEYVAGDTSLQGRVAFPNAPIGQPDAGFLLLNDPITGFDTIQDAVDAGFLVRTRADEPVATVQSGDTTQRDAAFASGAQSVSTDFPVPGMSDRWETDYAAQLPGGRKARCNPVSAPPGCDDATLENL